MNINRFIQTLFDSCIADASSVALCLHRFTVVSLAYFTTYLHIWMQLLGVVLARGLWNQNSRRQMCLCIVSLAAVWSVFLNPACFPLSPFWEVFVIHALECTHSLDVRRI